MKNHPLVANKQGICSRNININAIWVWAENTVNSNVLLHLHHQTLQFFGEPPVPTVVWYVGFPMLFHPHPPFFGGVKISRFRLFGQVPQSLQITYRSQRDVQLRTQEPRLMVQKSGQPVDMVNVPLFTGFYTSQVVQDFFHQQHVISSCQEDMTSQISTFHLDSFDLTGASNLVRNLCWKQLTKVLPWSKVAAL